MIWRRRPIPPWPTCHDPGCDRCRPSRPQPVTSVPQYISGGQPFMTTKPLDREFDPCGAPPLKTSARRGRR